MQVKIKKIAIENFKGIKSAAYDFSDRTDIIGANATGKSTIVDAFMWCIFNVNSLWNAKFDIRPLTADGEPIHNTVISATVTLDVDGKETVFHKEQSENWVKKRGAEQATFQGNVNTYTIDDYPAKEKDYSARVAEIVGEDVFKMLTSPTYFTSLPWKEQRAVLMRFVSETTDIELAQGQAEFAELIPEIEKAPSIDDIKAKYQKALTEYKKKQAEIPVRIDEIEKQRVDVDLAALELQRNGLNEQIADNAKKMDSLKAQVELQTELANNLMKLRFAESDMKRKANEELTNKRRNIEDRIDELSRQINNLSNEIHGNETAIERGEQSIQTCEKQLAEARAEWTEKNGLQFDETSAVCSLCGQPLPNEKVTELKQAFAERKAGMLKDITDKGNNLKSAQDAEKARIAQIRKDTDTLKGTLAEAQTRLAEQKAELDKLPNGVDISDNAEYKTLLDKISEAEQAVDSASNVDNLQGELRSKDAELREQLAAVEREIGKAETNNGIDERISALTEEQREVAQKIADQERMMYLLENFIRYKMDRVSGLVNAKFEMVDFRLFSTLINGGLQETCEATYQGVPFASLNSAAKIQCGLDIIKSLQGLYDVYCPIFIDNRESCTDIPAMDCQIINLIVSPVDKELRVVNE